MVMSKLHKQYNTWTIENVKPELHKKVTADIHVHKR
jgi:hypothetical protein